MRIRKFKKEDAVKVSRLICKTQREILSKYYPKKVIESFCSWSKPSDILKKSKKRDYYVAVEKGKVLGVNGIEKSMIKTMFVNPKYHKKGIGKKLIENIENVARKRKIKKLKVGSTTFAEKFYKKCGYKRIKKDKWEHNGVKFNVIVMEKSIK